MEKLQLAISMFINTYENTVPELKILAVSVPDDQVTNVTVAQEIVCVLRKLQKILPNNLGNFVSRLSFVKRVLNQKGYFSLVHGDRLKRLQTWPKARLVGFKVNIYINSEILKPAIFM